MTSPWESARPGLAGSLAHRFGLDRLDDDPLAPSGHEVRLDGAGVPYQGIGNCAGDRMTEKFIRLEVLEPAVHEAG